MSRGYQTIIIGGGAMGVSLLYHLAKAGWRECLLLEKNDLTHGSTWHAAGLCTHFAHNATIQELRATSVRLYRDVLPEETGQSCGFHSTGALRVTGNPDRMDEFRHVAGLSRFTGYNLRVVSPQQIAELHPLAVTDGLLGGIYEPQDGHVDPTLATNAMAQVAQRNGATIMRRTPALSVRREDGWWIVETAKGDVRGRHIVNAAGTWGFEVGRMMGINVPSVPVLHQYLVTATVPEIAARQAAGLPELPIIRDPEESWYARQERDGFILGPYEREAQVWSVDGVPPEFGAELLPADLDRVEHIIAAAMARVPALASGGIKTVINGPITFTPDANPLIGPAHGMENAWLLTGSSMGVMEGGGAGKFLAHWMTQGSPPMDELAVDSRRFGAWAGRNYRVEKAIECFGLQFGVHYPFEERPAARSIRCSPLHQLMLEQGAVMGVAHGWERPNWFSARQGDQAIDSFKRTNWFSAVASEIEAVSQRVALADLSVFSKFEVGGPGATAFMAALAANIPPKPGRISLMHALTPAGGTASEFTAACISPGLFYLTSAAAAEEMDEDLLHDRARGFDVTIRNRTEELAVIGLMGPLSRQVLQAVVGSVEMPWLSVREMDHGVRLLRVSYVGELGYELHVEADRAAALFKALQTAGELHRIGYYGAFAANSMRLEKAYRGWGLDLTTERSPLESGLASVVKADGREFTGRDAMLARAGSWSMVLLAIEGEGADPFYAHTVYAGGSPIGIVTSGAYGHRVQQVLALAYLREPVGGRALSVNILGGNRPARILDKSPYDPANSRMKC